MKDIDYWKLCDSLSVHDAALLIIGEDPSDFVGTEKWSYPKPYAAVEKALLAATNSRSVDSWDQQSSEYFDAATDTFVQVGSLTYWLHLNEVNCFFTVLPNKSPQYLDRDNPFYSPKLAAAVNAWLAVTTDSKYQNNGKTIKQNLENWLTSHAADYDLVKDDGEVNKDAISNQVAKVANWGTKGGAPKTPIPDNPSTPLQEPTDEKGELDDLPF